jgi:hypothetical protein
VKTFLKLYRHWPDEGISSTKNASDDSSQNVQEKLDGKSIEDMKHLHILDSKAVKRKGNDAALSDPPIIYVLLGVLLVSLLILATLPIVSGILIMGP